jgi:hypothetical protein
LTRSRAAFVAWLLASFGCGGDGPVIQIGTGVLEFVPLEAGAEVRIVCGSQGGQHLWVALRSQGIARQQRLEVQMTALDDGAEICRAAADDVFATARDGWNEVAAMICLVPRPAEAVGRRVRVEATARDLIGNVARAETELVVAAPETPCGG